VIAVLAVAALVAGTVAAMAVTQHLRREGTVISAVSTSRFSCTKSGRGTPRHPRCSAPDAPPRRDLCPGFEGGGDLPISFFLKRADTVTVKVVDFEGNGVRTLARDVSLSGNRRHCFPWDRRDDAGRLVRRHRFRLLVTLREADREAIAGEPIAIRSPRAGAS
jgi:hypothetical protein